MARPFKHRKTGVYWFRKAVPQDLRGIIGKTEINKTLDTKDAAVARTRHAEMAVTVEREWQEHRRRQALLSGPMLDEVDNETIARAGKVYYAALLEEDEEVRLDGFSDEPRLPLERPDDPEAANDLIARDGFKRPTFDARQADREWLDAHNRAQWARGTIDPFYAGEVDEVMSWPQFGIRLAPNSPSRKFIARALQSAAINAEKARRERDQGEPIETPLMPEPAAASHSRPERASSKPKNGETITSLLADWWKEAQATGTKPSTYDSYARTVKYFITFLGHDDATHVAPADVVAFKDHRLASINPRTNKPVLPKTVMDSDLVALKSLFGWAVINHRVPSNPATGISIKRARVRNLQRDPGFTDEEAAALLKAADLYTPGNEHPKTAAGKRWLPWLMAYTGARVGEVAQLRKQDIKLVDGMWIIHITPEAGTVKTDKPRWVTVHLHLIEKGFPEFVTSASPGHLFLTPSAEGDVLGPLQGLKNRLAELARSIVTDPRVAPNHGWRHRFRAQWRLAELSMDDNEFIQGWSSGKSSARYGMTHYVMVAKSMAKFPRQDITRSAPQDAVPAPVNTL
ncbi:MULTISPECIES: DUF6538 domain-containing protein [unclassified Chelatococcus]|nr:MULTISPECIES: DUF6538 domain-containing protein [unclassified Chelatococcus]CAH1656676.1 Phage integrase family protein [Hyphomicrobiales bacterium]MBS7740570.1 hypothetical protein [Chelatococcus sp. HY11]MBX3544646.1 hypothetical protein [Chelatococcus sp.]MCO5078187.1 hypothetical protein [Chelatococcus sp.]CAH1684666.1 Phage integrase family protein [Hyphomicrobiales bacterium]